ncbi:MAG: signal recognition particle-docking protein FtsY [Chlamydiae bacterium GWC2_50_10]|nr:MAG: signal recognition particle-docking protein FtsY [Chlamydiae bacterium GWA2_50_15]OGN54861.1 MAG: signal recognition particle-docking protein FtsY [Chlamydiae bacterium GWC2_50_10]OGN55109.1 MAG: signal recognition particle-docking protein FtsY [Chlamydiae bacterium GWF2_49_8]OGN58428.1 MAG: signal recognition particle-docking protein FtsY [Chlamydiae bacterium RIFCSPHIGHO2_02_FULL_49_29]OGN64460.1 MAG: signal recognition particle-docking protein FtsY [Chlamydiae bacterium RIFCSPHIGHO2_
MFQFFKAHFNKFKAALKKSSSLLTGKLKALFQDPLDEKTYEKLEQILFEADLGGSCTFDFVEKIRKFIKKHPQATPQELINSLKERALEIFEEPPAVSSSSVPSCPHVLLVVGVNGSGKTTTIAKLAARLQREGKSLLLAAADTFRAAAVEQLTHWAEGLKIPLIKGQMGGDPAAVVYDALHAAQARGLEVVIIDTAGRLQNKRELMQQLDKMKRTCSKLIPGAPQETLLVLDATTGQNGLDQALVFHEFTPLTGIILTKLDGSAKGGIALAVYHKLKIPIQWVGLGEEIEDLQPFDPKAFVEALFALE